jgi:hypothetical protein
MNPFILNSYISPEYFCDREKETQEIISAVNNGRNLTLISLRRMGKTGLIKHVFNSLEKNKETKCIYIDIMTTSNLQDFTIAIAKSVIEALESKSMSVLKKIGGALGALKPSFNINPLTGDTSFQLQLNNESESEQSLKIIFDILQNNRYKIVIAIDEFQQILNYPEKNTEAVLRSYIQHLTNVNFIFSGSRKDMLTSIFLNQSKPFYLSSEFMYLDTIEEEKYIDFIRAKFFSGKITIDAVQIKKILELTRSHTFYVQLFCNKLYENGKNKIDNSDIVKILNHIFEENKFIYENYRLMLTDFQWKLLCAIAKEGNIKEIMSKDFIGKYNLGAASSVKTAVTSLLNKEMIFNENEVYRIYDIFLSLWLANKM